MSEEVARQGRSSPGRESRRIAQALDEPHVWQHVIKMPDVLSYLLQDVERRQVEAVVVEDSLLRSPRRVLLQCFTASIARDTVAVG